MDRAYAILRRLSALLGIPSRSPTPTVAPSPAVLGPPQASQLFRLSFIVEEPILKLGCTLGEGPLYDDVTGVLHFVDIEQNKVHHYNTLSGDLRTVQYDEPVSCLALRKNGQGLACAAARGFALLDPDGKSGVLEYLASPISEDELPYTRFNDGACDSAGRFYAGTMSKQGGNWGKLWRYDPADRSCVVVDEGPFTDSNGLGWSPDGLTLYFTDSLVNNIHAYTYSPATGALSERRIFVDALSLGLPAQTFPDGLCIDDEGGVWSARWGGSCIVRYTPKGNMDVEIRFPKVLKITACCFGGLNGDVLYVTTAHCGSNGQDGSKQEMYPYSGHLFAVELKGLFKGAQWRHQFGG